MAIMWLCLALFWEGFPIQYQTADTHSQTIMQLSSHAELTTSLFHNYNDVRDVRLWVDGSGVIIGGFAACQNNLATGMADTPT